MPEEKGIMYELLNVDADKASEEKLRALVKHLQGQMRDVYPAFRTLGQRIRWVF